MAQPSYLSREGLENLKSELQHLRTVRRHDIAERIQQSRERGGTVSSAEADPSQRNDIQRFSHRPKPVRETGRRRSQGQRPVGRNQA